MTITPSSAWIYAFLSAMSYRADEKDYRLTLDILGQGNFENPFDNAQNLEDDLEAFIGDLGLNPIEGGGGGFGLEVHEGNGVFHVWNALGFSAFILEDGTSGDYTLVIRGSDISALNDAGLEGLLTSARFAPEFNQEQLETGSELLHVDEGDWFTNVKLGSGTVVETQYEYALALAQYIQSIPDFQSLTITGQSLGGGLAALVAAELAVSAPDNIDANIDVYTFGIAPFQNQLRNIAEKKAIRVLVDENPNLFDQSTYNFDLPGFAVLGQFSDDFNDLPALDAASISFQLNSLTNDFLTSIEGYLSNETQAYASTVEGEFTTNDGITSNLGTLLHFASDDIYNGQAEFSSFLQIGRDLTEFSQDNDFSLSLGAVDDQQAYLESKFEAGEGSLRHAPSLHVLLLATEDSSSSFSSLLAQDDYLKFGIFHTIGLAGQLIENKIGETGDPSASLGGDINAAGAGITVEPLYRLLLDSFLNNSTFYNYFHDFFSEISDGGSVFTDNPVIGDTVNPTDKNLHSAVVKIALQIIRDALGNVTQYSDFVSNLGDVQFAGDFSNDGFIQLSLDGLNTDIDFNENVLGTNRSVHYGVLDIAAAMHEKLFDYAQALALSQSDPYDLADEITGISTGPTAAANLDFAGFEGDFSLLIVQIDENGNFVEDLSEEQTDAGAAIFSGFGNDEVTGTNFDDYLALGDGENTVTESGGEDVFIGGEDNDTYLAGDSADEDLFLAGLGEDTIDFSELESGITLDTSDLTEEEIDDGFLFFSNDGAGGTTRVHSVEKLIGTEQSDRIILTTPLDATSLTMIDLGEGIDTLDLSASEIAVSLEIGTAGATGPVVENVEQIILSDSSDTTRLFVDNSNGAEQVQFLIAAGLNGDEVDIEISGEAETVIFGEGAADIINVISSQTDVFGGGGDDIINIEGTGEGSPAAYGGAGTDIIVATGSDGDLYGGTGTDTLTAGSDASAEYELYGLAFTQEFDTLDDALQMRDQLRFVDDMQADTLIGGAGRDIFHVGEGDIVQNIEFGIDELNFYLPEGVPSDPVVEQFFAPFDSTVFPGNQTEVDAFFMLSGNYVQWNWTVFDDTGFFPQYFERVFVPGEDSVIGTITNNGGQTLIQIGRTAGTDTIGGISYSSNFVLAEVFLSFTIEGENALSGLEAQTLNLTDDINQVGVPQDIGTFIQPRLLTVDNNFAANLALPELFDTFFRRTVESLNPDLPDLPEDPNQQQQQQEQSPQTNEAQQIVFANNPVYGSYSAPEYYEYSQRYHIYLDPILSASSRDTNEVSVIDQPAAMNAADNIIDGTLLSDEITGTELDETIYGLLGNDVIFAGDGDDILFGGLRNDRLNGEAGADTLRGESGDDILTGGLDDDTLIGGAGDDTYIYARGDGNDILIESDEFSNNDRLVLNNILASDVTFAEAGEDTILTIAESSVGAGDGGTITLQGGRATGDVQGIDVIVFDDGTELSLLNRAPVARGDTGIVIDLGGDGIILASTLLANDTDLDGSDTISLVSVDGPDGISISLNADGNVAFALDGSTPTGPGVFTYTIRDDNGTTSRASVQYVIEGQFVIRGTPGNDVLDGTAENDVFEGLAGDDRINAGDGDDILIGGLDNDILVGDFGSDTYIYNSGDGNDVIVDASFLVGNDNNTLQLTDLNQSDVSFIANGDDLFVNILATGESIRLLRQLDFAALEPIEVPDNVFAEGLTEGSGIIDAATGATDLDISSSFAVTATSDVLDSDIYPHVRIDGVGNDQAQTFILDVTEVGSALRIDIDGAGFDSILELRDANGVLIAQNDDSVIEAGGTGSTQTLDSYVEFITTTPGPFTITLRSFNSVTVPAGATYTLNVSVLPEAAVPPPPVLFGVENIEFADGSIIDRDDIQDILNGVVNAAPIVGNVDLGVVAEDNSITFSESDLLANSSDPDVDDVLSVIAVDVNASFGIITDNGNGTYSFTPAENVNGDNVEISFTVSDGTDSTNGIASVDITPINDAPIANNIVLGATNEDVVFSFIASDLLAGSSDVDGDDLSITAVIVDASFGVIVDNGDGSYNFTPAENFNGDDIEINFTVSDGEFETSATATLDVIAVNDAPEAGDIDLGSIASEESLTFSEAQLLAESSDVDADNLSVSDVTVDAAIGAIINNGDGTYTFTPATGVSGDNLSINFTITDGEFTDMATAIIDVTLSPNTAPVVMDVDLGTSNEDEIFTFMADDLLAGSSDVDGDDLFVTAVAVGTDFGTILDNGDGSYSFTPAENFNGDNIEISFTVSDGELETSATATLDVITVNDAPTAGIYVAEPIDEDGTLLINESDLLAISNDVDGDELSITSLSVVPALGIVINNNDGTWTFTPTGDLNGQNLILAFTVSDGDLSAEGSVVFDINPINDAPVAANVNLGASNEDEVFTFMESELLAGSLDVDSDTLSVTAVTVNPAIGVILNNGDGSYSFTPAENFNGDDVEISFTVSDGDLEASAIATLDVIAVNDGPVASDDSGFETNEDTALTIAAADLLANDNDLDGDTLTIISVQDSIGGTAQLVNGYVVFTPSGTGAASFTYTVSDGNGGEATATVNLTVNEVVVTTDPTEGDNTLIGTSGTDIIDGLGGDDIIDGLASRDTLIGGRGSDTITGGLGDDILTGDTANGANNQFDQDIFSYDELSRQVVDIGNDIITDFDTNNYRGGENNYDTLSFSFNGTNYNLSTGRDIVNFVYAIEHDGDIDTDALRDGNDIVFVFDRNEYGLITDSVRLENVIGDDGIWNYRLNNASIDNITSADGFVLNGQEADDVITGYRGNDFIQGAAGADNLVGGRGSDTIVGGAGNDVLTGDQANGQNNSNDRDVFQYGDVETSNIGNDVITDFDTNNYRGGENNFDRLNFTFDGYDYSLSTGRDIVNFVYAIEHDGDLDTDAIRDGADIIFVFQRNGDGIITDSIRLEDVIGDDGIWTYRLNQASIDDLTSEDIFASQSLSGNFEALAELSGFDDLQKVDLLQDFEVRAPSLLNPDQYAELVMETEIDLFTEYYVDLF